MAVAVAIRGWLGGLGVNAGAERLPLGNRLVLVNPFD
jgi:hypothetical protein